MNNWYVLTGSMSSGKSTMIQMLADLGYRTIDESARAYIDEEMAKGKTIEEIRADEEAFQYEALKMKIAIEQDLPKEEIIFFDRGIPDTEAYYRLHGFEERPLYVDAMKNCTYKKILLLDYYPLKKDYARIENEQEQHDIHHLLHDAYKKTGIPIVQIPAIELREDRLAAILSHVDQPLHLP